MGPALPGVEDAHVELPFADGGRHRVESIDGVAVAKLFMRVQLGCDGLPVLLDGAVPAASEVGRTGGLGRGLAATAPLTWSREHEG